MGGQLETLQEVNPYYGQANITPISRRDTPASVSDWSVTRVTPVFDRTVYGLDCRAFTGSMDTETVFRGDGNVEHKMFLKKHFIQTNIGNLFKNNSL